MVLHGTQCRIGRVGSNPSLPDKSRDHQEQQQEQNLPFTGGEYRNHGENLANPPGKKE